MTEAKNSETITLEEDAATEDGQVLLPKGTVITLRRPRGGALRGANLGGLVRMEYDQIAMVAPRITTPPLVPHIFAALDPADVTQIAGEIANFLLTSAAREALFQRG